MRLFCRSEPDICQTPRLSFTARDAAAALHRWNFDIGIAIYSYAIAGYVLVCSIISSAAAAMLHDYTNQDISAEYDHGLMKA